MRLDEICAVCGECYGRHGASPNQDFEDRCPDTAACISAKWAWLGSKFIPVVLPIGYTASGLPVYAAGTRAYIEKMHTLAPSVYANQLPDVAPIVSKYAGRECPCGMASADCEYHR